MTTIGLGSGKTHKEERKNCSRPAYAECMCVHHYMYMHKKSLRLYYWSLQRRQRQRRRRLQQFFFHFNFLYLFMFAITKTTLWLINDIQRWLRRGKTDHDMTEPKNEWNKREGESKQKKWIKRMRIKVRLRIAIGEWNRWEIPCTVLIKGFVETSLSEDYGLLQELTLSTNVNSLAGNVKGSISSND